MSESDFYTVNHGYEAQDAPREWPTWELTAHGSAAPAPRPATPDEATASDGRGCPAPRLDPLGSWCSARLTFADGARIDVLVTVSDDHITVEDVRADPPLRLDGLAELARWIEGPLDDAFRTVTGRPRRSRPAPRGPGPAAVSPERAGGPMAAAEPGCDAGAADGAAPEATTDPAHPAHPAHELTHEPAHELTHESVHGPAPELTHESAGEPKAGPARGPTAAGPAHGTVDGTTREAAGEPCTAPGTQPPQGPAPEPAPSSEKAAAAGEPPAETGGTRSRVAERRKLAAEAYRRAQREGRDPVLAVMLATGRNRRRSLRLIAGARDDGLLTPRHNKR
ncbi:hypothetical protein SSP35_28_00140 [Streptomyces sp. NBRC 110611]|uniref:DUF6214 family protein n=1 Tax=Streptomyces sp. NBRC 110611 TaxID=1621259 RepID=UPI000855208F|nr:DUF6214 family protein [Streptomyces sp. NBRC 110611]GAU71139.1 hypothetical protein SSP35_28_00140 [Streptomyces sp. NBRC 110611]